MSTTKLNQIESIGGHTHSSMATLCYVHAGTTRLTTTLQRAPHLQGEAPGTCEASPVPIVAAIFDAFGTTVQIKCKRHPFRQLLRIGAKQGRKPRAADLHCLMTSSLGIERAAELFGISLNANELRSLEHDLVEELESITVYPDAIEAFRRLKAAGVATAICSNLASPYGPVLRRLLGDVDGFALSYELGMMKPHEGIYLDVCNQLAVRPQWDHSPSAERVVMIGDSRPCDRDGPRAVGISGYYLDRSGGGEIADLVQFVELVVGESCLDDGTTRK